MITKVGPQEKRRPAEVVEPLKALGYLYLALDLAGNRLGSLNEGLDVVPGTGSCAAASQTLAILCYPGLVSSSRGGANRYAMPSL